MNMHRILVSILITLFLSISFSGAYAQSNPLFIVMWDFDESTPSIASVYAPLADNSYYIINYPDGILLNFDDRRERYIEVYYQQAVVQNLIARIELTNFKKPAWDNPATFRVAEYVVDSVARYDVTLTGNYQPIGASPHVAFKVKETGAGGVFTGDDAMISEITIPKTLVDALPGKPNRFAASWAGESKDSRGEFENGNYILMLSTKKYPNGAQLEAGTPTEPKPLVLEYKNLSMGGVVSTCRISLTRLSEQPGGSATVDLDLYCIPGNGNPSACQAQIAPATTGGCMHESLSNQQVVFEQLSLITFTSTQISLEAEMWSKEFIVNNIKIPSDILLRLSSAAVIGEAKQNATAPAAAAGQTGVIDNCNPVFVSLTINNETFDQSTKDKKYSAEEIVSRGTCITFDSPCVFQMATFEVWKTAEAHELKVRTTGGEPTRDYAQLITLGSVGEPGSVTLPAAQYIICAGQDNFRYQKVSRTKEYVVAKLNEWTKEVGKFSFRAELCPEGLAECKSGAGWFEIIPTAFPEVQPKPPAECTAENAAEKCNDNNPCTKNTCNAQNRCEYPVDPDMEGKKVTLEGKEYLCKNGVKTPIEGALYISQLLVVNGDTTNFEKTAVDKKASVPYNSKFDLTAKNVKKNTNLYMFMGDCPAKEADIDTTHTTQKYVLHEAASVTSDSFTISDIVASKLTSLQKLTVCQYANGALLPSDSITVTVLAPDISSCTNLICALAKIDIKFVLDIFR